MPPLCTDERRNGPEPRVRTSPPHGERRRLGLGRRYELKCTANFQENSAQAAAAQYFAIDCGDVPVAELPALLLEVLPRGIGFELILDTAVPQSGRELDEQDR